MGRRGGKREGMYLLCWGSGYIPNIPPKYLVNRYPRYPGKAPATALAVAVTRMKLVGASGGGAGSIVRNDL